MDLTYKEAYAMNREAARMKRVETYLHTGSRLTTGGPPRGMWSARGCEGVQGLHRAGDRGGGGQGGHGLRPQEVGRVPWAREVLPSPLGVGRGEAVCPGPQVVMKNILDKGTLGTTLWDYPYMRPFPLRGREDKGACSLLEP